MDAKKIGRQIAALRKERGLTQESLAEAAGVSPQAVSKWENGHSLPETALLPRLAKALDASVDMILSDADFRILSARFGDGIESSNVTNRLNRLAEGETLDVEASAVQLACAADFNRPKYLIVEYKNKDGIYFAFAKENQRMKIGADFEGLKLPDKTEIVAAVYGTAKHCGDVMRKLEHYKVFGWKEYRADHEHFPSDPANDETEYLTFVYLNKDGINFVTCAEGESIALASDGSGFFRKTATGECFIADVPALPEFGKGMECSWAAALTSALQAMGIKTDYTRVMGVSGACYRIAFYPSGWDYSSVDGLVAYDFAAHAYKAFGFKEERFCRVEKNERAMHRERIAREIRNGMPVLGINLRVAAEWGVICGYRENGEVLFCRTKFDAPTIANDPVFMRGWPEFKPELLRPDDCMQADNWPFLISYFADKFSPPSDAENLINSLKVFVESMNIESIGGYKTGFAAYEAWRNDLLDDGWYKKNDGEYFGRRFSVNQFCTLALFDARRAARDYLKNNISLITGESETVKLVAEAFEKSAGLAEEIHGMLDSGFELDDEQARAFWTREKRIEQARLLGEISKIEREAARLVEKSFDETKNGSAFNRRSRYRSI